VQEHPKNVAGIAIRQLSTSEAVLAGGRSKDGPDETVGVDWYYAPDGAGISEQLSEAGILPEDYSDRYKSQ